MCKPEDLINPTIEDFKKMKERAIEREMAIVLLTKADNARYGTIVAQAVNNRLLSGGKSGLPDTMAAALELLNNSMSLTAPHTGGACSSDIGASFLTDGQPSKGSGAGRQGARGNT